MDALSEILKSENGLDLKTVQVAQALERTRDAFLDPRPRYVDDFRIVGSLCQEFSLPPPGTSHDNVAKLCRQLAELTWREAAWAVSRLYYDQIFKHGVAEGRRQHLGNSLFGVARLAAAMGHFSGARHHASLALIADVLWEHRLKNLSLGGGSAFHVVANHSDSATATHLVDYVRELVASPDWRHHHDSPVHPAPLLAACWFPSKSAKLLKMAEATEGLTFVDRLLRELDGEASQGANDKGILLEVATALLLDATPGFEVRGGFVNHMSQIDIVATYRRHPGANGLLPEGYVLVECKNWKDKIDGGTIDRLGRECKTAGAAFGILVSREGITGESRYASARDAEARRASWRQDGVRILVLTPSALRQAAHQLHALEPFLKRDFERLHFGKLA